MRRYLPGLNERQQNQTRELKGLFLVQVEAASYRWHAQKPFLEIGLGILEPQSFVPCSFSGRLYCTERALWKLTWFLRDFGYDVELFQRNQIDEKALLKLRGIVRTTFTRSSGRFYQNLESFAPIAEWETLSCASSHHDNIQSSKHDV